MCIQLISYQLSIVVDPYICFIYVQVNTTYYCKTVARKTWP